MTKIELDEIRNWCTKSIYYKVGDKIDFANQARYDIVPALLDYIDELHRGMDRLMEAMKE